MSHSDAATQYLEKYLNNLPYLSMDLHRNANLLREIDIRIQREMRYIDEQATQLFPIIINPPLQPPSEEAIHTIRARVRKIKEHFNTSREYSDHKTTIAEESYQLIDKYIRQLDVNIDRFREDIQKSFTDRGEPVTKDLLEYGVPGNCFNNNSSSTANKIELPVEETVDANDDNPPAVTNKKKRPRIIDDDDDNKENIPNSETIRDSSTVNNTIEMAVNPNEPTYCLCNQVSFGEMIACDNENCAIEWFHFGCVSLTAQTAIGEQWFCPNCK